MRVLCVVHYPVFGGPHNRVLRLDDRLRVAGIETTALIPDDPGNAADRLRKAGVPVVQTPLGRLRATRKLRSHASLARSYGSDVARVRACIRSTAADIVVIGGLVNAQAALAARAEGVPLVWQIVDTRTPWPVRVLMMPIVAGLADTVMYGAQAIIDAHPGARRLRMPCVVSRPAVDTDLFVPSPDWRDAARAELGIPADAPVVGTVANVNPQKGLEYFVEAGAEIYRSEPATHFLAVGARDTNHALYQAQLDEALTKGPIPPGQFHFAGARPDVERYYPAMDVKLITSVPRSEGTTTTAMEAMACGVPVVAADVGGVKEVVLDGRTGYVVPPLDARALARRALLLLGNASLRAQIAGWCRQEAEASHSLAPAATRQLEAYEAAIAHHADRRRRLRSRLGGGASNAVSQASQ